MERLDRLVATAAGCGRREAQSLIRRGAVTADGAVCRRPDAHFEETVRLTVSGREAVYRKYVYIMLHKPQGVISATENAGDDRPTVVDLLPPELKRPGLFPAGRLDADTTGFVLLTDDGNFAHEMLAPKKHVAKRYLVHTDTEPDAGWVERFRDGLTLADGTVCAPAQAERIGDCTFRVTLHEGMYHQIKRMFAACGAHVTALHRFAVGGLELDGSLRPGESRLLTEDERRKICPER